MPPEPRPNPDVVSQELEGEIVLVHLQTNRIYALNSTAARLWQLLQRGIGIEGIRDVLGREFDVEPRELEREVEALLAELATQGLVVHAER